MTLYLKLIMCGFSEASEYSKCVVSESCYAKIALLFLLKSGNFDGKHLFWNVGEQNN